MHITLRQLKVFEAVARHSSFTRAAEELHLTQPAVSMQVKHLESAIGLPLFEHMGKRIYLTETGAEVLRRGLAIDAELRELSQVIEELKGSDRGRLAVSVATTVNYFATRLLAAFCREHPSVEITLEVTNREGLLTQLEQNRTDIVLMGQPPDGLDLAAEPFLDNPLVVIAPPDHPLTGKRAIPLSRLREETFLMRERGSGTRSALERFCADKDLHLASSVEMNSNEAIKQSVEAGLGLGVVSIHTVELELEAGRLVTLPVRSFPIKRRWYLVHRREKYLSAVALAFKDFVLSEAVNLSKNRPRPRYTAVRRG